MIYKAYIIKRYNKSSHDYNQIKELYIYGKKLYLTSTYQLNQGMKIENYLDNYILPNEPDFVPSDYISDVQRVALNDYEMNKIKPMGPNSSIKIQVYTSDIEFYEKYFNVTNINLTIDFDYIDKIKNVYSIIIKQINNDEYELVVEVSIRLDNLNKIYHFDHLSVESELNNSNNDIINICIRDFDYIDEKSTIYIENRNKYNKKFNAFQSLIDRQSEFSYNLTKAANIISQMRETIY